MKALDLYKWIAGSSNDFTRQFQNNEALYNQARSFWKTLENSSSIIICIFILIGIFMAYWYYKPFNNKPHRHYKPKFWLMFMFSSAVSSLIVTLLATYLMAEPRLNGAFLLEFKIAVGNLIYTAVVYFIISVIWCNFGSTNACRIWLLKK